MSRRITTYEIAKIAKVNQSTVSRALSPSTCGMIGEKKRRQILSICDRLHFHSPILHSTGGKTWKVGLILGAMERDLSSPNVVAFVTALCNHLQKNGYLLTLIHAEGTGRRMSDEVRRILTFEKADVYIIGSPMLQSGSTVFLRSLHRPLIILDVSKSRIPGVSTVSIDMLPPLREIWKRIPVEFHRKMAFFGRDNLTSNQKLEAIRQTASEFRINPSGIRKILYGPESVPFVMAVSLDFRIAMERFDELNGIKFLWCGSDFGAFGLCEAFRAHGMILGRDVFTVSFDNVESLFEDGSEKFLSSIASGHELWAEKVCELAMELVEDPAPRKILVPARYVSRKSFPGEW